MQVLTDWSLNLDVDRILRGQGINPARARQRFTPMLAAAEEALQLGQPLRVNIFVGGPPSLTLAAVMPLPEHNIRQNRKNHRSGHPLDPGQWI